MDRAATAAYGTPSLLRDINYARVLSRLRQHGPLSRAALARHTGMSKVTASSVVADLLDQGVLQETEFADNGMGRRPMLLDLAPGLGVVAAADIDAERAALRVVDLRRHERTESVVDVPAGSDPDAAGALARLLAERLGELRRDIAPGAPLLQVTVAVSASVGDGASLSFPGHPRYLEGPAFGAALRQHLPECGVALVNDTNAAAVGEARLGAARDWDHFAFLGVRRSGVGMGLMLDGELYRGSHGWAGEIGVLRAVSAQPVGKAPSTIEDLDAFNELARVLATSFVLLDLEALVVQLEREEAFDWLTEIRNHLAALVPFPVAIVESALAGEAPLVGALELALEDGWRSIEARVSAARTRPT